MAFFDKYCLLVLAIVLAGKFRPLYPYLKHLLLFYLWVWIWVCEWPMEVRGQGRASDALELVLQLLGTAMRLLRIKPGLSRRDRLVLTNGEQSFQNTPHTDYFNFYRREGCSLKKVVCQCDRAWVQRYRISIETLTPDSPVPLSRCRSRWPKC